MLKQLIRWLWPQKEGGWVTIRTPQSYVSVRIIDVKAFEWDNDEEVLWIHAFDMPEPKPIYGFGEEEMEKLDKVMAYFI